jgi:sensor domain CHASE-containing protein
MPTDSLLLSIAVCGVFLAFAAVLAWVDHRTSRWQRSRVSEKPAATAVHSVHKKAA